LNFPHPGRDKERTLRGGTFGGNILMKSVQPDGANPIPLRSSPPRISTILIRFVGLLFLAVVVLALAWSR
jgi:hypothetical protein